MKATWITLPHRAPRECFYARKKFHLAKAGSLKLRLSATPAFRAWIDGNWIGDGPARGWPHRYFYEEFRLDLAAGEHELLVLVHGQRLGSFVHRPRQTGLCAEAMAGGRILFGSDRDWQVAADETRANGTPRIFPLAGEFENVDGRRPRLKWRSAAPVASPLCEPSRLSARDVAPPRYERLAFPAPEGQGSFAEPSGRFVVPVRSLVHEDSGEDISINTTLPFGLVAAFSATRTITITRPPDSRWTWFVNGRKLARAMHLPPGKYFVGAFTKDLYSHLTEVPWEPLTGLGLEWRKWPADGGESTIWSAVFFRDLLHREDDFYWTELAEDFRQDMEKKYRAKVLRLGRLTASPEKLREILGPRLQPIGDDKLFFRDPHAEFVAAGSPPCVKPGTSDGELVIARNDRALSELHFDLKDQRAGFIEMELTAPAGTRIDCFGLEHVTAGGIRQHTDKPNCNRNGFRYVTKGGRQRFFSVVRRSGRHWFLRVKNPAGPVRIHRIGMIESGYAFERPASFSCSDPQLTQIWATARRTMELSCDDTFVDSLYEQALWVGDAYVEQAYALNTWNAQDLSLRCLKLAADSLHDYPIVLNQVPSSWASFIPVWSMLWGFSVWDYFFHTGDRTALAELWPAFRKNLHGLLFHLDKKGLFNAPTWNLFEWADIEWKHRVVLYNTLFLAGLLDRGTRIARELDEAPTAVKWEHVSRKLRRAVENQWDKRKQAYPDSLDEKGQSTGRFSVHTQFLALLFGGAENPHRRRLRSMALKPPAGFAGVASPFALHFLYEALEQTGDSAPIVTSIKNYYGRMLDAGATTFWEALPGSHTSPEGFPTRSHCHGWSCAPLYFLPRIILGIRQTAPGGAAYVVRPHVSGLAEASGSVAGAKGKIHVRWRKEDNATLLVHIRHSKSSKVTYEEDASARKEGLKSIVTFEAR